ncbi:MAG: hypothetical protein U5J64_08905 [Halobacteriales archaeon]|nr:hypothetical protein [Halobacteriales archaeon]
MSTETSAHRTEVGTETSIVPEDISNLIPIVPVLTCVLVVFGGSLFILGASPAPGSIAFGAVAVTMAGVAVGGFIAVTVMLAAPFVAPLSKTS